MSLVLYASGTTTPLSTFAFASTPPGSVSASLAADLWLDHGTPGNVTRNIRLAIDALISAGVYAETGLPLVDRQEVQCRVVDSANPSNDPHFSARVTGGWFPAGAGAWFLVGDLWGNCRIGLEFRYVPSLQGGTGTVAASCRVRLIDGTAAVGRTDHTGAVGVVTGLGNPDTTEWNNAPTVIESGTPDALANVSARSWVVAGADRTQTGETVTLNQEDSASAPLVSGEAYYGLITQNPAGTTCTLTKGVKAVAASAVLPAAPAGHLKPIASVIVHYHVTASVITNADITILAVDGRGLLTYSASSLTVTIGAIAALLPTVYVFQPAPQSVLLTASVTSIVYLDSMGLIGAAAAAPEGSLPLWSCVTDGSGVTGTPTDLRTLFSAGLMGPPGPTGSSGTIMLYGTVAPTTEGVDTDFYLDTVTSTLYGPKASGTWPSGVVLIGPAGANGSLYATTSTTSLAIATGSKAFTVAAGLSFVAGLRVRAASAAGPTNWMEGEIASYSGATLTVTVDLVGGSGTLNDWSIGIAGERGATGSTGAAIGALLTAKGELATHDGGAAAALAVGTDGQVLGAASGEATGLKWVNKIISAIGGANVATGEATSSTSYTNLSTSGPAVTLATGTAVILFLSAVIYKTGTGATARSSVEVSGATTIAASDANGISGVEALTVSDVSMARVLYLTGLTPGSNTFTLKYRVDGGSYSFYNRSLVVMAL
jgi:hypothetical protein